MPPRPPELIEMRLDGTVLPPVAPSDAPLGTTWPARIAAWAILVAVIAGLTAAAALAFWFALALLPVALLAGLIAWAAIRFHLWRSRRGWNRSG